MTRSHNGNQEDLILTSEDFSGCGWKDVLAGSDREDYSSISQAFSDAARQAISEDRQAHGKVLSLLAQACSMMLSPDSVNEPFQPFNESGERSLDEMGVIRIPGGDIRQIVDDARNSVRGKALNEALEAFVNLVSSENARELRESTIEQIRNYPMQFLFSGTAMSRDGRVIARRPGMIPHSTLSDNREQRITSGIRRWRR